MFRTSRFASMSPAGDGGSPAGGGAPTEMPAEWMEAVVQKVSAHLQKALTSRDAQADKKREADQAAFKKMLEEALAGKGGEPPVDDGKGGGKGKDKDNTALQTLQKRLDEMAQRSEAFEKKAAEERAARRQVALTQTVHNALSAYGIEGSRAKAALALLQAEQRISFQDEDSDELTFRGEDGLTTELTVGLRTWAKSEDAKLFLPASGSRGSGGRPGGGPAGSPGNLTNQQRMAALNDLLDRNLP